MNARDLPNNNGEVGLVPFERMSEFLCSPEWHIMRLDSAVDATLALYSLAIRLTHAGKKNYHASVPQLMHHFDRSEATFHRAYGNLRKIGFFILVESGKDNWEPNTFSVLPHDQWAKAHPNQCAVTFDNNWTDGYDPLGIELFNVSGGKVKFRAFQIGWYRNNGLTDEEIVMLFKVWYPAHAKNQKGKKWRNGVGYQFGKRVELVGQTCRENPKDRATVLQNALTGLWLTHGFESQSLKDLKGLLAKARVN